MNDEWVVGEKKGGDQGIFPVSFVDAVPDSLPLKPENKEDTKEDKQVSFSCSNNKINVVMLVELKLAIGTVVSSVSVTCLVPLLTCSIDLYILGQ